jgi:hypothetical protein
MNLEVIALERQVHELKYELDRAKHEINILKINSESFERRMEILVKNNEMLWKQINLVREDIK